MKLQQITKLDSTIKTTHIDNILQAATSVFARYGYRNTDVQIIADELGIGKASIYRRFPSKQELFFAAVDRGMQRLSEHLDEILEAQKDSLDPINRLKLAIRQYFIFFKKNPELVELFFQERAEFRNRPQMTYFIHRERQMSKAQKFFQELISTGEIRDLAVDSMVDVLSQTLYGTLFVHFLSNSKKSLEQRAEDIITVFVDGLLKNKDKRT